MPHYEDSLLEVHRVVVGPMDNNVYVIRSKGTGDAVLIDAANEHELLLEMCRDLGVRKVIETHGHWDHIQAVPAVREAGYEVSVTAEVHRVVELILEHARTRPHESLGVIALGIRHAERIDAALRTALAGQPALEDFFADDSAEPFFVKNLERVQGDERDAIILSIGYGKHPDGRMRYQWGPLLRDGGERDNRRAAVRRRRLPGRLRGHPSRRRRSDGTGDRGGRSVVPSVGQRPRSQPAAQRASSATRLAIPPSLVDQLVPRSAERGRQAPGGL